MLEVTTEGRVRVRVKMSEGRAGERLRMRKFMLRVKGKGEMVRMRGFMSRVKVEGWA